MLETEVPADTFGEFSRLLDACKEGCRLLTYLDCGDVWRCRARTLSAGSWRHSRFFADRYPTSWSVQRGGSFISVGEGPETGKCRSCVHAGIAAPPPSSPVKRDLEGVLHPARWSPGKAAPPPFANLHHHHHRRRFGDVRHRRHRLRRHLSQPPASFAVACAFFSCGRGDGVYARRRFVLKDATRSAAGRAPAPFCSMRSAQAK